MESPGGFGIGGEFLASLANLSREIEIVLDVVLEIVGINEVFTGVVRRVDVYEFHFSSVGFLEKFKHFEVVTLNHEILCRLPIHTIGGAGTQCSR